MKTKQLYGNFRLATVICLALVVIVTAIVFIYGKNGSFLMINSAHHPTLDLFFQYATLLGDGLIYIPIVLYCIFFNRSYLIPVISGIIICTLLAQGLKHFVFEDQLRPFSIESDKVIIHKIDGVKINRRHSFPSGHTSTAFTMALLLAGVLKHRSWILVLPLVAMIVGYSRVYLAQHFLTDVLGGMVIGIISAGLSLLIYKKYRERKHMGQTIESI